MSEAGMRVTYFGSDLTDPATVRRIHILRVGGADVKVIGYRRVPEPVTEIEGFPVVDLGRAHDSRLASRLVQIMQDSCKAKLLREIMQDTDVVIGRNLEMTAMAQWACHWVKRPVPLVYECLDIHRAFLGRGVAARALRQWERRILRQSASLVVSSPGFITNYFRRLDVRLPPVILAENKRVMPDAYIKRPGATIRSGGPPWRIGWFGKLRCTESFHILHTVAQRFPALLDIEMRGQPLPEVMKLIGQYLPLPNMRFNGPYTMDDVDMMYRDCDFTWVIEYYNRGTNSDWCLANRLYEGGYNNCPSISLDGNETAAWLRMRKTGILFREPRVELEPFLTDLTTERYSVMRRSCENVSTGDLVWTAEECRDFVARIGR